MRSLRRSFVALLLLGGLPAALGAQETTTPFRDSWFWGAKGGRLTFSTSEARTDAPMVGADWVITRTRVALNIFAEQSYFDAVSTVEDSPTRARRRVDLQDLRRVGFAGMFFTPSLVTSSAGTIRPYFSVGYTLNFVKTAVPQGDFASANDRTIVLERVDDAKTRGKLTSGVGLMWQWRRFAPYAQGTVMPTQGDKQWLLNGDGFSYQWEAGLRYNFGSSISKN